jgi:hypothetical protein
VVIDWFAGCVDAPKLVLLAVESRPEVSQPLLALLNFVFLNIEPYRGLLQRSFSFFHEFLVSADVRRVAAEDALQHRCAPMLKNETDHRYDGD